ncbi:MAG: DMT family transporter [Vulcanimicrobiaceae bacterium]
MKRESVAYAAILVLAAIWGYNWVVIKIATDNADPFSVAALRSGIATLCLFAALIVTRRSLRPTPFWPTTTLGLLQTTSFTLLSVGAIATGGAGKTAILVYTMPFWVVLLAWPSLHERVSRAGWIALALAAAGLALVLTPLDLAGGLTSKALAVAAAIVWAASAVYGKVLRTKHATDLLALTTWQMLYGTLPLVAFTAFVHAHVNLTPAFLVAIAYVAIPGTALGWLLWMFVLSRLPAGVVGIASLLTPVIGVFSAWLQLGERPGSLELVGMGCILAALVVNVTPGLADALAAQRERGYPTAR